MYLRPCFLVVDREFAGSISSRKLVLETAKFNVITAYSFAEARAMLDRFPNVQGTVITSDHEGHADEYLRWARAQHPGVKAVVTGAVPVAEGLADRHVEGFAPDKLLSVLRELFPEAARGADQRERVLEEADGKR